MKNITLFAALILVIGSLNFSGLLCQPAIASPTYQDEKPERDELEAMILKKIEERKKELEKTKGKTAKEKSGKAAPTSSRASRGTRTPPSRGTNRTTRSSNNGMRAVNSSMKSIKPATTPAKSNPTVPRVRQTERTLEEAQPTVMSSGRNENIDPNVRLQFNFRDEEWQDVIEWFAEQIGYGLFYGDANPPAGTLSYIDGNEFSLIEALDFLNSRLAVLNPPHVLVRNGKQPQLILVNESGNFPAHLIENITPEFLHEYSAYEVASCKFDLGKLDGNVLASQLREDVSEFHLDGFFYVEAANQLVIRERVRILRRFQELLELAQVLDDKIKLQTYTCNHIEPDLLLVTLRPMMGFEEGSNVLEDGTLSMAVQPLGDKIFLKGTPERIDEFMQTAKLIDIEYVGGDLQNEAPFFKVHPTSGDLDVVFQVIQTLLDGEPNVRLDKDETNGNLFLEANQTVQDRVTKALETMGGGGDDSFAIISVRNISPSEAVSNIEDLLGIDPFATEATTGPRLVADTDNDRVMVHAAPPEIALIKRMIADIDTTDGDFEAGPRRNTRIIPLSSRQSDTVVRYLEIPGIMDSLGRENRLNLIMPEDRRNLRNRSQVDQRFRNREPERRSDSNRGSGARGSETRGSGTRGSSSRGDGANADRVRRFRSSSYQPTLKSNFYVSTRPQEGGQSPFPTEPQANNSSANGELSRDQIGQTTGGMEPSQGSGYQQPMEKPSVPGAPIEVRVTDQGLVIYGDDLDAVDDLEAMILDVISDDGVLDLPSFFYLDKRQVSEVKTLLEGIFGLSSGGGGGGGGGGITDFIGGAVKNAVGGGLGDILGLGGDGGGGGGGSDFSGSGIELEGEDVQFSMDVRTNMLIVIGATSNDLDYIGELIDLFDIDSPPQDPNLSGKMYSIPVKYRDAMDMKTLVETQYSDLIRSSGGGGAAQGNQQNVQEQLQQQVLRQLGGGGNRRGGRAGGGGGGNAQSEQPKATLGVDEINNSLLVTGPEFIYLKVLDMVERIDVKLDRDTTMLKPNVAPDVLVDLLETLYPDVINVIEEDEEGGGAAAPTAGGGRAGGGRTPARGGGGATDRRAIETQIRNAIQGQGGPRTIGAGRGGRGGGVGGRGGRGGR